MNIHIHTFPKSKRKYQQTEYSVEYHQEEKFVVAKAYAVCDPGTVVVHFEDALATWGAVMSAFWLSSVSFSACFRYKCSPFCVISLLFLGRRELVAIHTAGC